MFLLFIDISFGEGSQNLEQQEFLLDSFLLDLEQLLQLGQNANRIAPFCLLEKR